MVPCAGMMAYSSDGINSIEQLLKAHQSCAQVPLLRRFFPCPPAPPVLSTSNTQFPPKWLQTPYSLLGRRFLFGE